MATLSQLQYMQIPDVGLGLFTDVNPLQIPIGGASECSNVVWVNGFLQARPGLSTAYTPAPNADYVSHLNLYTDFSSTSQLMRLSRNGTTLSLYKHNGAWSSLSGAIPGGSASVAPTSCNFKGQFFFTTGDGDLYYYDGTTLGTVQSLQSDANLQVYNKPRIVIAGDARLFLADCYNKADGTGTRVPYRVAWSDLLNPGVWQGGIGDGSSGCVDLPKDSTPVTGLYYQNSTIMVFKPNSIFLGFSVGPPAHYGFKEIVSGIGCVAHATIKRYREGIICWLGDDNVYVGGINRQPQAVGDRIRPRLRQVIQLSAIEKARAVIDRQNHIYYLFLPDGVDYVGKVVRFFAINLRNGSWWEGSFDAAIDITDGLEYRDAPWSNQQLLSTTDGRILSFDFANTADLGVPFSTSWTSGVMSVRQFFKETDQASFQMLRLVGPNAASPTQMQLAVAVGKGLDRFESTIFGTQVIDGSSNIYQSGRPKTGETAKLQISTTNSSSMPKLASIGLGAIPQGLNVKK